MNSIPIIRTDLIIGAFDKIRTLYSQDTIKVLNASVSATAGEYNSIRVTADEIDPQLDSIRNRLARTSDEYGQKLFIKLIEELYEELCITGALGVNIQNFLEATSIDLNDYGHLKYTANKLWHVSWMLNMDENQRPLEVSLRGKHLLNVDVVPEYVLQYVQQAMLAFKNKRHAVSLALMTIALEGTLRDALAIRGYTYTFGTPSQDIYEIKDMHVYKDAAGFKVIFPEAMPNDHSSYLGSSGDPEFRPVRIKRILKGSDTYLEIRNVNDLIDYWSSRTVVQTGTVNIGGLGVAIDISRNTENILSNLDLPQDFDEAIKAVRNKLIHLPSNAMTEHVDRDVQGNPITLSDFLKNKNKVFDAVCTIGDAVNKIYKRISSGTL